MAAAGASALEFSQFSEGTANRFDFPYQSLSYKTGSGLYQLDYNQFGVGTAAKILAGTFDLGTTFYSAAPSALQKATIWFDASNNSTITDSGQTDVNGKFYVMSIADPRGAGYPHATIMRETWATSESPILKNYRTISQALYFQGPQSGNWAEFRDANDAHLRVTGIRHAFCVQAGDNAFGFLPGAEVNCRPDFHPGSSESGMYASWHTIHASDGTGVARGKCWRNGKELEPYGTGSVPGIHVMEYLFNSERYAEGSNIFNDRSLSESGNNKYHRQGGDFFCEMLLFTCDLTEGEREEISEYLCRKWLQQPPNRFLNVAGAGRVVAHGDTRIAGDANVELADGAVLSFNKSPALVAKNGTFNAPSQPNTWGLKVSYSANDNDKLVKTGKNEARFGLFDEGVKQMDLNEGVTTLQSVIPETSDVDSAVACTIPYADFETGSTAAREVFVSQSNGNSGAKTTKYGWTGEILASQSGQAWDAAVAIVNASTWTDTQNGLWPTGGTQPIAPSRQFLQMKGDVRVSCTIDVPRTGTYLIKFLAEGRNNNVASHKLLLTKNGQTIHLATFGCMHYGKWVPMNFRTPVLEAGQWELMFENNIYQQDSSTCIDNLEMLLVEEKQPDDNVWPLPNGTFEVLEPFRANGEKNSAFAKDALYTWKNPVSGWEVIPDEGYDESTPVFGPITHRNLWWGHTISMMNVYDDWGEVEMQFLGNWGEMRTTFTPPAGTWRLRADAAESRCSGSTDCRGQGKLHVVATINEAPTDLGTVSIGESKPMRKYVWPTEFTVDGETPVTLVWRNLISNAAGVIDNVELVRVDNSEVLANGSFENGQAPWRFETTDDRFTAYICTGWANDFSNMHFGYGAADGIHTLRIQRLVTIEQDITFAEPGLYKFSIADHQRMESFGFDRNSGHLPFIAYWRNGTETNIIARIRSDSDDFIQREYYFRVPAAGNFTFGIRGNEPESSNDHNSIIDTLSIKPVTVMPPTPELPADLAINVAQGAWLNLQFDGVARIGSMKLDGQAVTGSVNSTTHPDFILGPGEIYVVPKGTLLLLQ